MILQYLLWARSKTANGEEWGMRWQSMAGMGISLGSPPMVDCFAEINNKPRSRNIYLRYSRLSITRTLANSDLACANSNQSWFLLDFLLTFAVILPSITWTLDNSNLPLTRSDFCFPSDHIYIILPSILEPCYKRVTSQEKKNCVLKSETLNLFQNNCVNSLSLLFCHSSSNSLSIPVA